MILFNRDAPKDKREEIQDEALDAVRYLKRSSLAISMGIGKTLIGLRHMNEQYKLAQMDKSEPSFLVVIPKKVLIQSWKDEVAKFGYEHLLPYITFSTYRSLTKQSNGYTCVYFDEVHNLLHSHYDWLSHYDGKILGFTGTPPKYDTSDNGMMIDKFCPVVYTYLVKDAVSDKVLNDYKIIVHSVELSLAKTHQVTLKNGGGFKTSEREHYLYWSKRIDEADTHKERQMMRIMRMKALMEYNSKEHYAKNLLSTIRDKCLVFCNTQDQADRICGHSYHSSNPASEVNLAMFKSGDITNMSCVLQISEGTNIPGLKASIIIHAYGNEKKFSQRLARCLRLHKDDNAVIHVLQYKDTVDEKWVQSALEDFNSDKIIYL